MDNLITQFSPFRINGPDIVPKIPNQNINLGSGEFITTGDIIGGFTPGNVLFGGPIGQISEDPNIQWNGSALTIVGGLEATSVIATGTMSAVQARLRDGAFGVILEASAGMTADYSISFPPSNGLAGQVLALDASLNLQWTSPSGTPTWADVLAVGNTSGGTNAEISAGDFLQIDDIGSGEITFANASSQLIGDSAFTYNPVSGVMNVDNIAATTNITSGSLNTTSILATQANITLVNATSFNGGSFNGNGTGLTQLGSIDTLSDVDTSTTPPVAGDYLRFDGTNWVTFTPNDLLQLQDSAGGQDFNTAAGTAVTWSLQTVLDSAFSHTAGTAAIGINRAGLYRITYSLSSDTNANTRRTCRGSIVVNGAESSASVSYGYGRNNTDDKLTAGASTLRQLNAGDTVEIFTQQAGSAGPSASIATESWVNIEFIRP